MSLHQGIEEMPERGEGLVPGRSRARQLGEVFACEPGCDLAQIKSVLIAPAEEAAGYAAVGPPGVFVAEGGLEKIPRRRRRR